MLEPYAAQIESCIEGCVALSTYSHRYHFMNANNALIFRYDNAPHHDHIDTFPHHKHLPDHVTASLAPDFAEVFAEAEMHVLGLP